MLLAIVLFFPLGLYLLWTRQPNWGRRTNWIVTGVVAVAVVLTAAAAASAPPPKTPLRPAIAVVAPTSNSTTAPTSVPTDPPTAPPTVAPTAVPTAAPTVVPSAAPTTAPTAAPIPVTSGFNHAAAKQAGATAICRDGSWSYSAHRSGTCSHHGGVNWWTGTWDRRDPGRRPLSPSASIPR